MSKRNSAVEVFEIDFSKGVEGIIIPPSKSNLRMVAIPSLLVAKINQARENPEFDSQLRLLSELKLLSMFALILTWDTIERRRDHITHYKSWGFELPSKIMKSTYGNQYHRYLSILETVGAIERSRHYRPASLGGDSFSKKVYVNPEYFEGPITIMYYRNTKYTQFEFERYRKAAVKAPGGKWKYNALQKIEIDLGKAIEILVDYYKEKPNGSIAIRSQLDVVLRIAHKNMYYNTDTYGRHHTPLTCLKEEVRETCLRLRGGALGYVDLRASQPTTLRILLRDYARGNPRLKQIPNASNVVQVWQRLDSQFSPAQRTELERELDRFADAMINENGQPLDLYLTVKGWYSRDGLIPEAISSKMGRREVKWDFFKFFFGAHDENHRLSISLGKRFPLIMKAVKVIKSGKGPKAKNLMAYALQRVESYIVHAQISEKLEGMKIDGFFVHDSFHCELGKLDLAYQAFSQVYSNYGFPNAVKVFPKLR